MKHSTVLFVSLTIVAFIVISNICLWFMIARPEQWGRLVDRENDFWVSKGIVSPSLSGWFRQFEKGLGLKILLGISTLLGMGVFIYGIVVLRHLAHK